VNQKKQQRPGQRKTLDRVGSNVRLSATPKKRKIIGLGKFDSGVSDLATNKKYMEDYGRD
jgi:hypothetical protein